jgi:hypothetical protein
MFGEKSHSLSGCFELCCFNLGQITTSAQQGGERLSDLRDRYLELHASCSIRFVDAAE